MRLVKSLMDISGRKALVTGGAGHIGFMTAQTLVELGADVTLLDLDEIACQESVAKISRPEQTSLFALPCDLTNEQATRSAVQKSISLMGGLDILVHCAAYVGTTEVAGWAVPFKEQTIVAWNAAMSVNLTSVFTMMQEGREALAASGNGSVIFFGSIYGTVGNDMRLYQGTGIESPAAYPASKGGIIQLARYFATFFAPQIRVNTISPGGVWRDQPDDFHERYIYRTPMGRMATEEDLKGAVAYLASDLSAYVTGHNLAVDGGWTAW